MKKGLNMFTWICFSCALIVLITGAVVSWLMFRMYFL